MVFFSTIGVLGLSYLAFSATPVAGMTLNNLDTCDQAKIPTNLTPTTLDGGVINAAGIATIIAALSTPVSTPIVMQENMEARGFFDWFDHDKPTTSTLTPGAATATGAPNSSVNGAFVTTQLGDTTAGTPFEVAGPFIAITAIRSASALQGLTLVSMDGTTHTVTSGLTTGLTTAQFNFDGTERIAQLDLETIGSSTTLSGFSFATDAGNTFHTTAASNSVNSIIGQVGSGIIGRIRGSVSTTRGITAISIDMLDTLTDISISNVTYSGFTNNAAPSGPGTALVVGSEVLNNLNSTVQQSVALLTTSTVTTTQLFQVDHRIDAGITISVAAGVDIPLIAKDTATASTTWTLGLTTSKQNSTASTSTNTATFTLACPPRKFCTGQAFFNVYNLQVDYNATFTATTTNGATFQWSQSGKYRGSDSDTMHLTTEEFTTANFTATQRRMVRRAF